MPRTPAKGKGPASRSWLFTYNNYPSVPTELPTGATYCVMGKEKGKEGTPHLQGYIEFKSPQYLTKIQRWLKSKVHCEPRRGTQQQACDYSKKDGDYVELGKFVAKKQGKRKDIDQLYVDAKSALPLAAIADKHQGTYLKYYKAVQHVKMLPALDKPEERPELKVFVFFGSPGTGKTRRAYDFDPNLYSVPLGKDLWFDNYTGEKTILIDDFNGEMRLTDLLRLLDIYPIQVPIKGGFVWIQATTIIITTNVQIYDWYDWNLRQDSRAALDRRVTEIIEFNEPYVPPSKQPDTDQGSEDSDQGFFNENEETIAYEDGYLATYCPDLFSQELQLFTDEDLQNWSSETEEEDPKGKGKEKE